MIRPPGFRGAAFGEAFEGDLRIDGDARRKAAGEMGISPEWAFVTQVHSPTVVRAIDPGPQGEADAIFTTREALPIAVATADCVPVILEGSGFTAVVHAGWRGASSGVLEKTIAAVRLAGHEVEKAAIGPSIGPCCYEVGPEVADQFNGYVNETTWGTPSVDIAGFLAEVIGDVPVWRSQRCTYTDDQLNSYRRNRTKLRQVAVAWLPGG